MSEPLSYSYTSVAQEVVCAADAISGLPGILGGARNSDAGSEYQREQKTFHQLRNLRKGKAPGTCTDEGRFP